MDVLHSHDREEGQHDDASAGAEVPDVNRQRELDQGAADECHFGSVLLDVMRDALAHKCRHLSAENKQESCATQEPWDQPHESALWSLQQKQRADDRPYECHDEEWAQ